jgi:hypothetical protein
MDDDTPRVNTVFIRSRPARGVGVPYRLPTPTTATSTRSPGRYVPPIILVVFLVSTLLAPVVFWFAWLVFLPILWWGWVWGLPRNR